MSHGPTPVSIGTPPEPDEDDSSIEAQLGIEECVRYYPPDLAPVADAGAVFAARPQQPDRWIDIFLDVPYCSTICGFCPFNVYQYDADDVDTYLTAVAREIQAIKACHDFDRSRVRTVWIGGGTPSTLSEAALERLLTLLEENFDLTSAKEITVEIKPTPGNLTAAKLAILSGHRVTRISMGVQSTHADQLRILGRGHTADEAYQVVELVKSEGFAVNIDMMYRLPGQVLESVQADLDAVRARGIDHMSWFPYVAHEGTSLARRIDRGRVHKPGGRDTYYSMFTEVNDRMAEAGYEAYTPYHFSLTGRCEYHVGRWQMPQRETLGLGPGAFSFFNGHIYANEHSPAKYAQATAAGRPPVMRAKQLSNAERITRLAVLGIKFFELDMAEFHAQSGVSMRQFYANELQLLEQTGLVEVHGNLLTCTPAGRAFNNDVATVFGTDTARRTRHPQALDLMDR